MSQVWTVRKKGENKHIALKAEYLYKTIFRS